MGWSPLDVERGRGWPISDGRGVVPRWGVGAIRNSPLLGITTTS